MGGKSSKKTETSVTTSQSLTFDSQYEKERNLKMLKENSKTSKAKSLNSQAPSGCFGTGKKVSVETLDRDTEHYYSFNNGGISMARNKSQARKRFLEAIEVKLTVWRENRPTELDEEASDRSIRYRVAKFRAAAMVVFPKIPTSETWQHRLAGSKLVTCSSLSINMVSMDIHHGSFPN